jgi:phage FluMu protein Com
MNDQNLELKCPSCKKKLRPADRMEHATLNVKRTCRCGTRWSLTISPMTTKKDGSGELIFATHYMKWTCIGVNP